jgi:CysZ protein
MHPRADAGAEASMLDAAIKALSQMFSPPFRMVLAKSMGLALLLIVLFGFGLHRALLWLTGAGEGYVEGVFGPSSHCHC